MEYTWRNASEMVQQGADKPRRRNIRRTKLAVTEEMPRAMDAGAARREALARAQDLVEALGDDHEDVSTPGLTFSVEPYFSASGYSVHRLGQVIGMSEMNTHKIVNGTSTMVKLATLEKLAWVFGCDVRDFFHGKPHRPANARLDLLILPRAAKRLKMQQSPAAGEGE